MCAGGWKASCQTEKPQSRWIDDGEIMKMETGGPQWSPVSPIHFNIYILELFFKADS
jgi:hypothetical protein